MRNEGIYLSFSQFEAGFVSLARTQKDLDKTIEACDKVFKKIIEKNKIVGLRVKGILLPRKKDGRE